MVSETGFHIKYNNKYLENDSMYFKTIWMLLFESISVESYVFPFGDVSWAMIKHFSNLLTPIYF